MKIARSGRFLSLLALLLVAAMMLTMVGCGGKNEEPEQPDNVATEPSEQLGESTDAIDGESTDAIDGESTDLIDGESTDLIDGESTEVIDGESTDAIDGESTGAVATTQPTGGNVATKPTSGNVATKPTSGNNVATKPTTGGNVATKTTGGNNAVTTKPTNGKVTNKPTTGGNVATKPTTGKVTTGKVTTGKTTGKTNKPVPTQSKIPTTKPTTTTTTQRTLPPEDEDVLKQVPKSLSGTQIKMLLWWNVGVDDTNQAEEFKAATGIDVVYEIAALNQYQTVLLGRVMANNSPALAAFINEWYPQPITRGMMQPLDEIPNWNFKDEDVYSLSMMDQFGYKGRNYGVAIKGSNVPTFELLFFNRDILRQQGVKEDPYQLWRKGQWNWDTCLEIAMKCTDDKKGIKGIANLAQYYWMLSAGQDFVVSDPKTGLKNNIKNAEVLKAWEFAWDMVYTYKVCDPTHGGPEYRFYQGKLAMFSAGSYMMQAKNENTNYIPTNMRYDWGVVPFPSPNGKNYVAVQGTTWGFPARVSGDKLQAAAWYLRYWLDDYNYGDRDFYSKAECWEVMSWVWDQPMQSYNSPGVLSYGGEYNDYTIQMSLIDEADTKAKLASNLDTWYNVLESNIKKIENELT